MPDPLFADIRLASIYDDIEGARRDLDQYEAIVAELDARSVVDVGCGTGVLACRLARRGLEVFGIDPAQASLHVAASKPQAELVTWLLGDAVDLPPLSVDVATMTGNVAQVFVTDSAWQLTLDRVHAALVDDGHFVFEARDPAARGWEHWRDQPASTIDTAAGLVDYSVELTKVDLPLLSFRQTYRFRATGDLLTSDSTLRFRERSEIEQSLEIAGFDVVTVRDAPDRPGLEFVFIARRTR